MVCDSFSETLLENILLVLILILLEYGLRHLQPAHNSAGWFCLNPYSIGIWSATCQIAVLRVFAGVLILILLEYGLRHDNLLLYQRKKIVLILILLEYGLRQARGTRTRRKAQKS